MKLGTQKLNKDSFGRFLLNLLLKIMMLEAEFRPKSEKSHHSDMEALVSHFTDEMPSHTVNCHTDAEFHIFTDVSHLQNDEFTKQTVV